MYGRGGGGGGKIDRWKKTSLSRTHEKKITPLHDTVGNILPPPPLPAPNMF